MFTGEAGRLPELEQHTIAHIAAQVGVPATFLAAIRIAENGGPGREFGVLSENAPTYEAQCRTAALSIRNNQYRHIVSKGTWPIGKDGHLSSSFIVFMADRWAPHHADNDPNDLNANWPKNVERVYRNSDFV